MKLAPELTRMEKASLWVLGYMKKLVDRGYVGGGQVAISEAGAAELSRLIKDWFRPSDAEIKSALSVLIDNRDEIDQMAILIIAEHEGKNG